MANKNVTLAEYVIKFGEELGKAKFQVCVRNRERRNASSKSGRSSYNKKIVYSSADIVSGDAIMCLNCNAIMPRIQWTHLKKCSGQTILEYKEKYPTAELVSINARKKCGVTKEAMIALYGDEGAAKFESYQEKQATTNTLDYKSEKYGWSAEQFKEYNKSRACTLTNMIERHGEIEGKQLWEKYCERQSYTNSIEYFQEIHGIEIGKEKWLTYNKEKSSSSDPVCVANRLGITIEEALAVISSRKTLGFVSETEKEFVNALQLSLNESIKYTYQTHQFAIWNKVIGNIMFYDICCPIKKKIIEYNGDYWHANPKKYSHDTVFKQSGMTASEIWHRDELKHNQAIERGFEVLVVWESEYFKEGIDKVLDFWNAPTHVNKDNTNE